MTLKKLLLICTGSLFGMAEANAQGNVGIGTNSPQDRLHISGMLRSDGIRVMGNNTIELGYGVAGKATHAGLIGYQAFSTGLDIIGAGTTSGNRTIKFWAEGGSTFAGGVWLIGQGSTSGLYLGHEVVGKEISAGRIGYGIFTPGAMDIVGAGTNMQNRRIKLWAEGGTEVAGNMEVAGYTRLGTAGLGSPAIRTKKLTGVGPAADYQPILFVHGLDATKILQVSVFAEIDLAPGTQRIPPNNYLPAGYEYRFDVLTSAIRIVPRTGNSTNILNKLFIIFITYEE